MHRLFAPVIKPLLDGAQAQRVLDIGAGSGLLTRHLLESSQAEVIAIDPRPAFDPGASSADAHQRLTLHARRSLEVLASISAVDVAVLDGDPNWYTVINELRLLAETARREDRPEPVVIVHNVRWPFARRDGYHDPDAIPAQWRAPCSPLGLLPAKSSPVAEGLSLVAHVSLCDHEPRLGVRTAIDDFLAEDSSGWRQVDLPGLFGTGVLVSARRLADAPALAEVLDSFRDPGFLLAHLDRVERERILALSGLSQDPDADLPSSQQSDGTDSASAQSPMIANLTEQVIEAERRAILAQRETDASNNQNSALQWRLQQIEQDTQKRENQLLAALTAERDRAFTTETQRALLQGQSDELRARLQDLVREDERRREELQSTRAAAEQMRTQIADLKNSLQRSSEDERLARGRSAHLSEALESSQSIAERLRGEVSQLDRQTEYLLSEREEIGRQLALLADSRAWRLRQHFAFMGRLFRVPRSKTRVDRLHSVRDRLSSPLLGSSDPLQPDGQGVREPAEEQSVSSKSRDSP